MSTYDRVETKICDTIESKIAVAVLKRANIF